jgi:hypothetical protein
MSWFPPVPPSYSTTRWMLVTCRDCGCQWEKRWSTLKNWQGRCTRCAQPYRGYPPDRPKKPRAPSPNRRQKNAAVCRRCGVTFFPTRHSAGRFCSAACSGKERNRTRQPCATCGKLFEVRPCEAAKKFCSKECHDHAQRRGRPTTRTCEACGKCFPWRASGAKRFCSLACSGKERQRLERVCPGCGKTFELRPCESHWQHCSVACLKVAAAAVRLAPKACLRCGEIKPAEAFRLRKDGYRASDCYPCEIACKVARFRIRRREGRLSENELFRLDEAQRFWSRAVRKRDKYTCQFCGARGVRMHADHILSFARYPQCRLALWNGRTLCTDCHKWRHQFYRGGTKSGR